MNINPNSPVSISVVMCTYNGDKYLEQQIDSILCQTYPIHELIIQDDCSTDRTVTIIEAYQKRDPRVKLYINEAPLEDSITIFHPPSPKLKVNISPLPTKMISGDRIR